MYTKLIRPLALLSAILGLTLGGASIASADTGPWQWSDVSDKLEVRENRPIWASAYAYPYWYLTDGQELYSGGHVWKTDGSVMTDITAEIRTAGLSRVDDIVTDGQTVMFLKNVVSNTRNFEILTYKDGNWGYPASTWQSYMDSNETISSITGKDGVWMIVSTKEKLYRWTQSTNQFTNIALPSDIRYSVMDTGIYKTKHGYTPGGLIAVPTGNKWLVAVKTHNLTGSAGSDQLRFYTLDGTNFSEIKRLSSYYIQTIASNGNEVFIDARTVYNTYNEIVMLYRNNSISEIASRNLNYNSDWEFNDALVGYNGKSWIIVNNKKLYRLTGTTIENYGETRDYFITISGNGNGTFLVGGVESTVGNSGPTSPLTAKLVRIDEGTGYTNNDPVVTGSNEVWSSMSVSNNNHEIYHGQSSNVNIQGGSPNGVNRIEIWLNGNIVKTCSNTSCDYTIYGSSYSKGSTVSFNGRVVDNQGHESWTWLGEYYIPVDDYYNNNNNNNNNYYNDGRLSVWIDYSPSGNQMYGDDYKSIQAHANAQDGLKKLEIYVNDSLKRSCSFNVAYGEQNCYYTVYNNQYSSYDKIRVHVKAYDNLGRQVQTNTQYIYRDGYWDDDNNNDNGNYDSSVAAWFDGNVSRSTLDRDESRTITFYGNANRGLDRLELYANNNLIGTCYFNGAYGNKSCSKTIYGNDFNAGQSVTLKIKATDRDGYQNWSGSVKFNIEDDGSSNNNDDIYAWLWFEPSDTNLDNNETKTIYTSASADDGLNKIEIYANGSLIKTCNYSRAYGTQNCQVNIYGNNYNSNATINIYARATDYYGRTDTTETKYVYRNSSNNNSGDDVYAWMWFDPSDLNLDNNESKTINVGAAADDGLSKIEIYVDGSLKRTCNFSRSYGNQECNTTIYGNNYSTNRNVSVFARAYDYYNRTVQTDSQNIYVTGSTNNNNNNNTNNNVDGSLYISTNASNGYTNNQQITFTATGEDENGIDKIDIYVNAHLVKTCYNTSECVYTGGPYSDYSVVNYAANLTDSLGNQIWTGYYQINKTN